MEIGVVIYEQEITALVYFIMGAMQNAACGSVQLALHEVPHDEGCGSTSVNVTASYGGH